MNAYHGYNAKTNTASATVPMWCITAGTGVRAALYEINVGSDATPADSVFAYAVRRTSARGTQSATVTPNALDSGDPAAECTYDTAWSANPTITASSDLFRFSQYQKIPYRWVAVPGYEILVPATSGAGITLVCDTAASAVNTIFSTFWYE